MDHDYDEDREGGDSGFLDEDDGDDKGASKAELSS